MEWSSREAVSILMNFRYASFDSGGACGMDRKVKWEGRNVLLFLLVLASFTVPIDDWYLFRGVEASFYARYSSRSSRRDGDERTGGYMHFQR